MDVKVKAIRDFSNTIFGNVSMGDPMTISRERYRVWTEQGLVELVDPKDKKKVAKKKTVAELKDEVDAMKDKDDIEAFGKEHFDIDLDKRRSLVKMKEDVHALLDVMNND